jgi:hypothetical protein
MVTQCCNSRLLEAEVGGSSVRNQSGQCSQFKASLGYTVRPYFKTKQNKRENVSRKNTKL